MPKAFELLIKELKFGFVWNIEVFGVIVEFCGHRLTKFINCDSEGYTVFEDEVIVLKPLVHPPENYILKIKIMNSNSLLSLKSSFDVLIGEAEIDLISLLDKPDEDVAIYSDISFSKGTNAKSKTGKVALNLMIRQTFINYDELINISRQLLDEQYNMNSGVYVIVSYHDLLFSFTTT